MSIYLAALQPNSNAVHPLFKQRGVEGYTQSSLNSIMFYGMAHKKELAYDGYVQNIDIFLAATNKGKKLRTTDLDGSLDITSRPIPLLRSPTVGFVPALKMNADQEATFLAKLLAYKPQVRKKGANTTQILLEPTPTIMQAILRVSHENIQPSPDFWTPKAYFAYVFSHSIISEFLATNSYAGFPGVGSADKDECPLGEVVMDQNVPWDERVCTGENYHELRGGKRPKTTETEGGPSEDVEMGEDEVELYLIHPQDSRGIVLVAKPSPLPATNNIGPPAEVPHMPGLCFPYFDRMNVPDQVTIRTIMSRYFLRNFGSTRESQKDTFKLVKAGLEQLTRTKEGGEIAHIFSGIELALQTQSRMYVVTTNDEYSGFCLLGTEFSVVLNGVRHEVLEADALRKLIDNMASHASALELVCGALSTLRIVATVGTTDPKEVKPRDMKTGWALWEEIAKRDMKPSKESKQIGESLGLLAFSRGYKDPNVENIMIAMKKLSHEDKEPWAPDTPCFLPVQFNLYNDPVARCLAVFGSVAPSFINVKGSSFPIPVKAENDPNNVENEKTKKKELPSLLVALKPLHVAVNDMKKFMKDRTLVMDLHERAASSRNLMFTGAQRDKLYEGLRERMNALKEATLKRKAEDEVEGEKGKQAKTIGSVADMLDLF